MAVLPPSFDRIGLNTSKSSDPGLILGFWFFFHISAGHILLPILVATFLFTKAKRDITLINLCIAFIVTGICSCLLLYAGQYDGPEPNQILCIIQAGTTEACPPMWATAVLAFVFYMRNAADTKPGKHIISVYEKMVLVTAPYVVFIIFLITNVAIGARHPDKVTRSTRFLYCDIDSNALSLAAALVTSLLTLVAIIMICQLAVRLYKSFSYLRRAGRSAGASKLTVRLMIFGAYILVGFVFGVYTLFGHPNPTPRDMYIGSLGLAIFCVFGTQRDVFIAWAFWRRRDADGDEKLAAATDISTIEITKHVRSASTSTTTTMEHKVSDEPES